MRLLQLFVSASVVSIAMAVYGADVSQATYPDHWSCLHNEGYDFAVIRCWESIGRADPNCPHTIYNAWNGGMKDVDIYFFPCHGCGDAAGQINSQVEYLARYNITSRSKYGPPHSFGMIWLDIEGPQYWGDQSSNVAFIRELIQAAEGHGLHVGIYTSESQWSPITGNWEGAAGYPLWYAHYDGNPSFSDFRPFAGWSKPSIKQFQGTTSLCGAGIDKNWYP